MRNFENQGVNLRELTKYRKKIGNYQVLILDEWLNYKLSEKDTKNLYELFEQRSENHSTVFVGQYPVDEWHNRLGGRTQADSIMDRIIHNTYEISTNETNLRKLYISCVRGGSQAGNWWLPRRIIFNKFTLSHKKRNNHSEMQFLNNKRTHSNESSLFIRVSPFTSHQPQILYLLFIIVHNFPEIRL